MKRVNVTNEKKFVIRRDDTFDKKEMTVTEQKIKNDNRSDHKETL